MSLLTSFKGTFLVGVPGVSSPGKFGKSRDALMQFAAFSTTLKQTIHAG